MCANNFFGYFLFSRNAKHSSRQIKIYNSEIKESDKHIA
jgi:hypothetical protein